MKFTLQQDLKHNLDAVWECSRRIIARLERRTVKGGVLPGMVTKLVNLRKKLLRRKKHDGFRLSSDALLKSVDESEKEYLAFGRDLRRIYDRAREVSKTSCSLVALTEGERLNALAQGLKEFLDKNGDLGMESREGTEALRGILDKAGLIESRLQSFRNVVRTLQVLRNFIRIESIRFGEGENGFHALAEDVGILARSIEEKSSPVMDQSNSLAMLVRKNLARVLSFEQGQQNKGKVIAESIMEDLGALRDRHRASSQRLGRIRAAWEEITKSIGEIVSSLQFHDITRQRIEHVAEALRKFSEGSACPEGEAKSRFTPIGPDAVQSGNDGEEAYECYALQKAQLLHTKEELASATERIGKGLGTLSERISEMSVQARGVTGDTRGAGASFFSELEKAVVSLTEAVNEHAEINNEITSAVEQVTGAVSQMEGFLKDIVKIGIEMKMIALNAAIHAAQVGEQGLAMGVLAEHIHALSQDTSGRIASIGEDLHCIFDNAGNLKNCTALVSQRRAEEGLQMVEELKRMLPSLQQLDAEAITMIGRIEAEGEALAIEIRDRAEGLHFHERILQGIDSLASQIEKECMRIGEGLIGKGRRSNRSGEIGGIKEMEKRYTMQRERDVHDSTLASTDGKEDASFEAQAMKVAGGERNDKAELGENVELF